MNLADRPLERKRCLQIGPWPESEQREEFDRPIPAALVIDGEGGGAVEPQGAKRYLLMGLGRGRGGRKKVVDGEQQRFGERDRRRGCSGDR